MTVIDFRSDTVTLPSPAMREVMAQAPVGDDVYGEDPSVNSLEEQAAKLLGKEAGLFVSSGTMGNLCAHLAHTQPGQEVICSELSHTFVSEAAGPARVAGVSMRTLPQKRAELDPAQVEAAIRPRDIHFPKTALVWIEQPARGYVMPLSNLQQLARVCQQHGIPIHMDGARIFNAAIALGLEPHEVASYASTVMFCVSKGLAAPVGSVLVGDAQVIEKARWARKLLGGAMRQAGIVAAAGLYALEHWRERVDEDHRTAKALAAGLRQVPGMTVDRADVETNMFYVDLDADAIPPALLVAGLRERGVLVSLPRGGSRHFRFVTHYGITDADIPVALHAIGEVLAGQPVVAG